jgi:hypothetical protein
VERKTKVDKLDITAHGVRCKDTRCVARILNLLQKGENNGGRGGGGVSERAGGRAGGAAV